MEILNQKQGFKRREFEITGNDLKVKSVTEGKIKEWTVKIENIGHEKVLESDSNIVKYIGGFFFLGFATFFTTVFFTEHEHSFSPWVVIIVDVFFTGIFVLYLFGRKEKDLILKGGFSELTFFQDKPSIDEVNRFVNELIARSKKILIEKYGTIDPDLPEDTMMNQLIWLKNRDLISEDTYNELKHEYKTKKLINRL